MKKTFLVRGLTALLIAGMLLTDIGFAYPFVSVEEVNAASFLSNPILALLKVGGAWKRRNDTYREAKTTSRELNEYYERLITQAGESRRNLTTQAIAGEKPTLARAYVRVEAALRAEQKAAVQMIEAQKNQARKNFNRTLFQEVINLLAVSPGGQRLVGQIRAAIQDTRGMMVALQTAAQEGKPTEALQQALLKKAGDVAELQTLARGLGSVAGWKIDQALGGLVTRIEGDLGNLQKDLGEGIDLMDKLDGDLAAYNTQKKQPESMVENAQGLNEIFPVNRMNPVKDVVASAYAGAAAFRSGLGPGVTRGQMKEKIRDALEKERIAKIESIGARSGVGNTYCLPVGQGQYEAAARQLGQTPQQARNAEAAIYMVCYNIETQQMVSTMLIEEAAPEETEEPTEEATEIVNTEVPQVVDPGNEVTEEPINFPEAPVTYIGESEGMSVNVTLDFQSGSVTGSLTYSDILGGLGNAGINGTIDLESLSVDGVFSGEFVSMFTENEEVPWGGTFKGSVSEDFSSLTGNIVDDQGNIKSVTATR